jgi:hypothetical protein
LSLPVALAGAASAQAQTAPTPGQAPTGQSMPGPSRGGQAPRPIFGGGAARIAQSLTLNLSLGESFFRTESDASEVQPAQRNESSFLYGSGSLAYSADGSRAGATVLAASSGQYYSELSDDIMRGYVGRASGWVSFSARTRLTAEQEVSYLPAFQGAFRHLTDPTGGLLNEPASDVSASDEQWLSYDTRVTLSHMFSRRATLLLDYSRRQLDYQSSEQQQLQHQGGFRYTYQLGAGLGLRAGYHYSTGRTHQPEPGEEPRPTPELHSIDAGIDFSRAFSVSRRTTLAMQTGSSVVTDRSQTKFFVTGMGTLTHQLMRTWQAILDGGRNVDFADGFREPVVSDRLTGSLSGVIARRVQPYIFVSAIRGREALSSSGEAFTTYRSGAQLAVEFSRAVTWTVAYMRQETDFGDVDFLITPELRSHEAVMTGLSVALWRYMSLNGNYAFTTVDRRANDVTSPPFRRQTVSVTVSTVLPFYASVRK